MFKHFPDREALFAAASEIQEGRVRELMGDLPDASAPLEERIDAFVEQRARFHEFVSPVRRSALLTEPFSPVIAEKLKMAREAGAAHVAHVFAPELEALRGRAREDLHAALIAVSAWPTWESLRRHQGLDADRARAILRTMVGPSSRGPGNPPMRISVAADERTGVADQVVGRDPPARARSDRARRAGRRRAPRLGLGQRGRRARRRRRPGRAGHRLLLDRHGRVDSRQQGRRSPGGAVRRRGNGPRSAKWNDANVLALSLRITSEPVLDEILDAWFATGASTESDDADNIRHVDDIH